MSDNKTHKKLYLFQIDKIVQTNKQVIKEIDGKPVTILEPVESTESLYYFIRRPTRIERNDAELFESIEFSNLVRKGVITRSEVIKKFTTEDVAIETVYKTYGQKENELQRLSLQDKTPELEEKISKLQQELIGHLVEIQDFELTKSSVFNRTADSMARNKAVFWWILNLAYKIDGNKELPIFDGKDFEEKQITYDKLTEDIDVSKDEHFTQVIRRFFYLIPAWYTGQASKEEDFKRLEDLFKAQIVKNKQEEKDLEAEPIELVAVDSKDKVI